MTSKQKQELKKYLAPQLIKAKKLGLDFIDKIEISPIKNKKYRVFLSDGTHIDYGHILYDDYLQHKSEFRRIKFHQRFHNNKGYNNPNSGLFYSRWLLWT